jgi:hypothetical protein
VSSLDRYQLGSYGLIIRMECANLEPLCPSSFTTGVCLILDRFRSFQVVASTLSVSESASCYEEFVSVEFSVFNTRRRFIAGDVTIL